MFLWKVGHIGGDASYISTRGGWNEAFKWDGLLVMTILINLATYGTHSFVCTPAGRGVIRLDTLHLFAGMRCGWSAASAEVSITPTWCCHIQKTWITMRASAACAFERQRSLHRSEGNALQQTNNLLLVEEHGVKAHCPKSHSAHLHVPVSYVFHCSKQIYPPSH